MTFEIKDHTVKLSGDVDFATVLSLRQVGLDFIERNKDSVVFDFAQVTKVDSAGVALLIDWWRAAVLNHKIISFQNLPAKAKALIALSDLTDILGISADASSV